MRPLAAIGQALAPVLLLLWIQGAYLAAGLLLRAWMPQSMADAAPVVLGWLYRLSVIGTMCWLLMRLGRVIEAFLMSLSNHVDTSWDDLLLPLAGKAVRRTLPLFVLILGAPTLSASPALAEVVRNATSLLLIAVVAFVLFQIVDAVAAFVVRQHRIDVSDNLRARTIYTGGNRGNTEERRNRDERRLAGSLRTLL